jgi:hypothetical protein
MKKFIMLATVLMTLSAVSFASENSGDCTQSLDQELLSRSEAGSVDKDAAAAEKQEEVNSTVK